ncbi:MAG: NAD(P)-dependent oxidoreductase [Nanoarchaeota archaeon]|nr:NAD(P)-dependent oxidoreductase [Nanoarchaeota archaeon]MBU1028040.1 NAD(P)-dependent oxidoreductase [Nanoarchaeota archaeon]
MNIFITGNKGLIGSALEKRLIKEGHKIVGSIDHRSGSDLSWLKNLEIDTSIDLFIHAAAHVKINKMVADPKIANLNNAQGTFYALDFCRKHKIPKFVFFSSSRILSPEKNSYTASKIYGEELCKGFYNSYGIEYIIIRPSTVYGPFWDLSKRLVHLHILAALRGEELKIFGNPLTKTLDFTYIDDFIEGTMLTINSNEWNKEYNISGKEEYNVYDEAKYILELTGSKSQINSYSAEIAQPQKVSLDCSEIKKLGYMPKTPLEEGLRKTIEWYKEYIQKNPVVLEED